MKLLLSVALLFSTFPLGCNAGGSIAVEAEMSQPKQPQPQQQKEEEWIPLPQIDMYLLGANDSIKSIDVELELEQFFSQFTIIPSTTASTISNIHVQVTFQDFYTCPSSHDEYTRVSTQGWLTLLHATNHPGSSNNNDSYNIPALSSKAMFSKVTSQSLQTFFQEQSLPIRSMDVVAVSRPLELLLLDDAPAVSTAEAMPQTNLESRLSTDDTLRTSQMCSKKL